MKDDEKDKLYWDERLEHYDHEHRKLWELPGWYFQEQAIRKVLRELQSTRVLEIGFGTGRVLKIVRDTLPKAEIWGYDQSSGGLREAMAKVPDAKLLTGDIGFDGLKDDVFDLVIMVEVLLHNKPSERGALMLLAKKLGRYVLVVDPTVDGNSIMFVNQRWKLYG
jgi:SAM-dependent methyltransferase